MQRLSAFYYVSNEEKGTHTHTIIFTHTHTHFLRGGRNIWQRTIFDKATRSLGTIRVMSKVALMAGSSQQGKALRASVAWRRGGGGGEKERQTGCLDESRLVSDPANCFKMHPRHAGAEESWTEAVWDYSRKHTWTKGKQIYKCKTQDSQMCSYYLYH